MMVQTQADMGKDSEIPTDSHHTLTVTQPSTSSQLQQKHKSKKSKKRITEVPQLSVFTHGVADEHVTTTSNDPLLNEMTKVNQALEIKSLKRRVKKIKKKAIMKTYKLKRLYKIGSSTRVESSEDAGLDDQEDVSKQERMIDDLDANEGVALVDETQGRNDQDMFDTSILYDEEFVAEKEVSTSDLVLTAGEVVTTAGVEAKDKGKAKMIEPEKPLKRKVHIMIDEEVAKNLEAQLQAKLEEEKRLARQKEEEANIATKRFEDIQILFDKEMKKVNTFVDMDTKLVKGSEKAAEDSSKRPGATSLSSKSPTIVDYKIYKEWREDLEVLWSIVKARFKKTKPVDDMDNLLFQTLKIMFEHHALEDLWRNKPDLDTMSFDDLYNNFKIVKQEVKRTANSSSSSNSQNMAFVSSPSSTNEVNTAYGVSTANTQANPASTQVNTPSIQVSTANLSDATAFMADNEVPTNMAVIAFSDSEPEFEGYGPKASKSVSEDVSNEVKESFDAPLVKKLVSDDNYPQKEDQGYVNSGCSRHMTGNMSYLYDFKVFDRGYVTFGEGAKRGRITGKETLKTGKLDFKDVYFVKELKFNLLSVSQMCDKKPVFLTNTGCFVLSFDFKLTDESQCYGIGAKDETTCILKKFITEIENLVDKKVNVIRCDNGTEFNNSVMNVFCAMKDHLGKFDGFFVGYSLNSKAFRVYNLRTRKVEESLHIRFLEDNPSITGNGPKWLFDIDVLTKSMNYVPVVVGTNSIDSVGIEESICEGYSSKEKGSSQDCILMPLWKDGLLFDSFLKNASNDEPQPSSDARHKDDECVSKESEIDNQEKPENITQYVNTVRPSINTTSTNVNTEVDLSNISNTYVVLSTSNTRIYKGHSLDHVIGDVWTLVDLPYGKRAIGIKWIYRNKNYKKGIVVRNKARLVARGYTQEEGIDYDKVTQKNDRIFISQDKDVDEILKKFGFSTIKTISTPMETSKPLLKDVEAEYVDVHLYRSMIRSLMYLIASKPDIMFANCVKTVNGEKIQTLVDKKKVIIIETSVRSDLHLEDAEDMGEDSEIPTDSHHTLIVTQPSTSSQLQQKHKSKKSKKRITKTTKANQALKIGSLKRRVKNLEKKAIIKTHKLKRLYKIGSSTRVESFEDAGLDDQDDASKQGSMIDDLDADEGVALVDETRGRNDQVMFDTSILDDEEFVAEKEVSTGDPVLTADVRKKHFAALRAKEKRSKTPTKVQKRKIMSSYLKNMVEYKYNQLKTKSCKDIQLLFDKEMKRVNTFVDMDIELVKGSEKAAEDNSKRAGGKLGQEDAKRQMIRRE
uniref:Uncharacterized protein n=1 Tax=Tanacetum cinerariifolium TaxID=118510 RepID=A0A6L2LWC9_TANCI|nr:hypothetical protein [Tanacetum cinerariifolium]